MKIAIPTKGHIVDDHFGHCEMYSIFTINEGKITNTELLPSPQGCGCKSNISSILKEKGISIMLAGNMGEGAMNVLNMQGIEVIRGCSGDTSLVIDAYIKGIITDSGIGCNHHGNGGEHQCNQ
ncbi:MAG: NifB/NifX family molybdenum-iron cluster-binding protein [Bacteroidetes bacterium]|nr:NifB/NifX family molybdenum-iron cluster-binding protein [Bacteroidota bacterium]